MMPAGSSDEARRLAFQRALHFLKFRARSRQELLDYLAGKGFSPADAAHTVDRLEASGLAGDAEFARWWVESRLRHRPRGKYLLAAELTQKGVASDIIADVLSDVDEESAARSAARTRLRQWRHRDEAAMLRKLLSFLQGKGFPFAVCRQIASEMIEDDAG
jgi:regulatory protein